VLIVETIAGRQQIICACEASRAVGVRPGMTLAHARALLTIDQIRVQPHDSVRDGAALRALAHWAMRFSPDVAVDPPDGLLLDITGCQRLFRGEKRLVHRLADGAQYLGLRARISAAPTFGCAWAFARYGPKPLSIIDDARDIADLPIAALRVESDIVDALDEIGITRIDELTDLPRESLPSRFGPDLLLRLDQALGFAIETIDPIRPPAPVIAHRAFDGPTKNLDGVMLTVRALIDELLTQLQQRESGALQLKLYMTRSDAPPLHMAIAMSKPNRDAKHLWTLLRPQVENADLSFGIDEITLSAPRIATLPHEQDAVWHEHRYADDARLVDMLVNRLGRDRVMRIDAVKTHIPERAFVRRPATDAQQGDTQVIDADRPSILFDPPEPIDVIAITPDGPPTKLRWRGNEHRVTHSVGPERIGPAWWRRPRTSTRDYFKVQLDVGRWLWICRAHTSRRWFVHGMWG